jgi:hypothetical protein
MEIPRGPDGFTPDWMTQAFRSAGVLQGAAVTAVDSSLLHTSGGIMGSLYRLQLAYDARDAGPCTAIAKLPRPRTDFSNPKREVWFYRELADHVGLPVPCCYYGDFDEQGAAVMLLEDLAPACCGKANALGDDAQTELAVEHLARFHATWWGDQVLGSAFLFQVDDRVMQQFQERYMPRFLAHAGHMLPDCTWGEHIAAHTGAIVRALYHSQPLTLIHGDYQTDNLFYATDEGGAPFTVADWQNVGAARGTVDLAYYLCRGASLEERRAIEQDLLALYHGTLVARGVEGYTHADCERDYRMAMLLNLARTALVIGGMGDSIPDEHTQRYLDVCLPRSIAAVADLDAWDALPA